MKEKLSQLKEGDIVFFNEDGYCIEGKVEQIEYHKDGTYTFSIEGYSDCCSGAHRFSSLMIGYTIFKKNS